MTIGPQRTELQDGDPPIAGAGSDSYQKIRADGDIQFAPVETPAPSEPPGWLAELVRFLGELFEPLAQFLGTSWPAMKWLLIAGTAAMAVFLLSRWIAPMMNRAPRKPQTDDIWVPPEGETRALLEEADRLAADGDYDAATHLLLQRSVRQISNARPDWVDPSSTARELAHLAALPETARTAFATIADHVERSLFALRRLGPEDWQAARNAYTQFALHHIGGQAV